MYFYLADYITAFFILFGAILYSSVGHGGASSYIAIMSLMGTPVGTIKPIGLILNIIVSSIGGFRFIKSNFFSFKVFLPVTIGSVPAAFIGGYIELLQKIKPSYDFELLHKITKIVTHNLNKVIDINFYPTKKTEVSNKKHRPVGIGVQGLADTFAMMNLPFACDESKKLNKLIFETIYHAALEASVDIAIEDNPYSSFEGSPASNGILQYDMWNVEPTNRYNWKQLKNNIKKYGLRNSLLVAPMPTASTSQILGNNECFEPFTSNIYVRRTLAGEFIIVNKHLIKELIENYEWNEDIKNSIIKNGGSIQHLKLPKHILEKYKIV